MTMIAVMKALGIALTIKVAASGSAAASGACPAFWTRLGRLAGGA
jgi:hypothetical protein